MKAILTCQVLCESSDDDCECDPELDLVLDEEVNGSVNGDSVGVDPATCVDGLEHLAGIVVPWDHAGDGPETVSDFRITCSCKLNDGQPCQAALAILAIPLKSLLMSDCSTSA